MLMRVDRRRRKGMNIVKLDRLRGIGRYQVNIIHFHRFTDRFKGSWRHVSIEPNLYVLIYSSKCGCRAAARPIPEIPMRLNTAFLVYTTNNGDHAGAREILSKTTPP